MFLFLIIFDSKLKFILYSALLSTFSGMSMSLSAYYLYVSFKSIIPTFLSEWLVNSLSSSFVMNSTSLSVTYIHSFLNCFLWKIVGAICKSMISQLCDTFVGSWHFVVIILRMLVESFVDEKDLFQDIIGNI